MARVVVELVGRDPPPDHNATGCTSERDWCPEPRDSAPYVPAYEDHMKYWIGGDGELALLIEPPVRIDNVYVLSQFRGDSCGVEVEADIDDARLPSGEPLRGAVVEEDVAVVVNYRLSCIADD